MNKDFKRTNFVYNFEQRSDDWFRIRAGKITGSPVDRIMKSKGLGVGGMTYCFEIVGSSLLNWFDETHASKAMQKGIEREPLAIELYEETTFRSTQEVGFIVFNQDDKETIHLNEFIGISPDRLVGEEGGLEVKCPEMSQHTKNLTEDVCHSKYYDQIQLCLFVTKRKWWDLISYNPDFEEPFHKKITRIYPDKEWRIKFIKRATECKEIVDTTIKKIKAK